MTLQLHPKDWGQLQISVKVVPGIHPDAAQAQTVTAHIVAETPQVKAALENGSSDLRHALREAGLHLDRLTVTVQAAEQQRAGRNSLKRRPSPDERRQRRAGTKPAGRQGKRREQRPAERAIVFRVLDRTPAGSAAGRAAAAGYAGAYAANEPEQDETPERERAAAFRASVK